MTSIKAIEGDSVHHIQSGQVIVDLCSVVKELVENSLDAGASSIEVRFKNQGLDSIEVQDNGKGIGPNDFETVALKHYTSKLSTYEDLTSIDTFGFRGEALSSLCALSKFHILTARGQDGAIGRRLDFEVSGQLKGTSVVAAKQGTTVVVEDLFWNLPVRRKELDKNIKREYGKVISLLHAYACISVGVRFTVSNQMPKGKKVSVFSTKTNTTTKENITNVYGAKTLLALAKLDLHLEMEPSRRPSTQSARNWSTQATDRSCEVNVQGHISKPVFGEGRQAPDRQMFFVNSRPCGLPQISKAFNEVYKSFNVSQSPFIFANLIMDTHSYDVNVSPDKRTIMLHDQTVLLESLKAALTQLFEQTDHTVPTSRLPNPKLPAYQPLTVPKSTEEEDGIPRDVGTASSGDDSEEQPDSATAAPLSYGNIRSSHVNLIHNWVGRESENRREAPAAEIHRKVPSKDMRELVKSVQGQSIAQKGTAKVTRKSDQLSPIDKSTEVIRDETYPTDNESTPVQYQDRANLRDRAERCPHPMSTYYDDLFSQRPPQLPKSDSAKDVQATFGETVETSRRASAHSQTEDASMVLDMKDETVIRAEASIPTVTLRSQKATPGPVANAFDRMRPKRTPLQTAEITVGDTTTTTVIGSGSAYKRRRVHEPENSQAAARFGCSPLVARGLRNFAAPGSQIHLDSTAGTAESGQLDESEDEPSEEEPHVGADALGSSKLTPAVLRKPAVMSSDASTSDLLDDLLPAVPDDDEWSDDYVDEAEKNMHQDEEVARLIQEAEDAAARPTEDNLRRACQAQKDTVNRRDSTLQLVNFLDTSTSRIKEQLSGLEPALRSSIDDAKERLSGDNAVVKDALDDSEAESKLSLTVSKADFERMQTVGQFNLGFILAVRPVSEEYDEDDLFIIDQHAADEKYNYECLQRTVVLQSQRLVRPKVLDLTAVEEELVLNHADALKANGFEIETTSYAMDEDDIASRHCRLLTLPMSKEKTFELSDLEELLHLLSESPAGSSDVPRPKKVQRMLAMRACRSSIMVGKTLTAKQMQKVVRHMGEMEKPWNCPHGRPTMRHLAGLGAWNGWQEGGAVGDETRLETDWKTWLEKGKSFCWP